MITDTEARIIYANPACTELFAVGFDALLGQPPAVFGGESFDAAFYHDMWTILRRGDIWRGSLRIRRPNGTWRDTDATMSPVRDGAQAIVGYLASLRDVTEIRLLERQYTGAQKMEAIGRLAGGIAHDFNNLLTAIMGYAEIGQGQTEDPGVSEAFDDIRASASRAAALTWQLLAFSRQQSLKPRVVDLNVVTLSVSGLLRQLIG
ncbi:MAG: PAS domain-containing protein, partial [Thermoleophilia bacterium]